MRDFTRQLKRTESQANASKKSTLALKARRRQQARIDAYRTVIRLMMTLDPPIPQSFADKQPQPEVSNSASIQKRYTFAAKTFEYKLRKQHQILTSRDFSLTATTTSGQLAIVCQFIVPQKPPPFSYATVTSISEK